jgi:hypothetical protein
MVYPPQDAPSAESMPVRTRRPRMTPGRAALLAMMANYVRLSQLEEPAAVADASLLEIQKLLYFLQDYLRGYGDRTQQVLKLSPITLMPPYAWCCGRGPRVD